MNIYNSFSWIFNWMRPKKRGQVATNNKKDTKSKENKKANA